MSAGPMKTAAQDALAANNELRQAGEFERVAFASIDCVDAFRLLLREGSPELRRSIVNVAFSHGPVSQAAA